MRIPGWRAMTPAQLDVSIRRTVIDRGPAAVQVIARTTALHGPPSFESAFGGAAIALVMMRTMDSAERASWLAWSWGLCYLSLRNARRRRRKQRIHITKRAPAPPRPVEAAA